MMTLDEMKLAVCEKLPMLHVHGIYSAGDRRYAYWRNTGKTVRWPTEGLQVCHEARTLLNQEQKVKYLNTLRDIETKRLCVKQASDWDLLQSPLKSQLEALCRVWWPERFV